MNSEEKIDSKNICCKNDIMGRAWRIEYEGALYHILSRGKGEMVSNLDGKHAHSPGFVPVKQLLH